MFHDPVNEIYSSLHVKGQGMQMQIRDQLPPNGRYRFTVHAFHYDVARHKTEPLTDDTVAYEAENLIDHLRDTLARAMRSIANSKSKSISGAHVGSVDTDKAYLAIQVHMKSIIQEKALRGENHMPYVYLLMHLNRRSRLHHTAWHDIARHFASKRMLDGSHGIAVAHSGLSRIFKKEPKGHLTSALIQQATSTIFKTS